jgi:hypothetical protein
LEEETGLTLPLTLAPEATASEDVAIYVAEAPPDVEVVLDDEHDRYLWLSLEEALPKCLPQVVASGLANAAELIHARERTK